MVISNSLDRLAVSKINGSSIGNAYCHIYVSGLKKEKQSIKIKLKRKILLQDGFPNSCDK